MKNLREGHVKKWPYWATNKHFRTGYEHFHFEADFVDEFPVAYEYGRLFAAALILLGISASSATICHILFRRFL